MRPRAPIHLPTARVLSHDRAFIRLASIGISVASVTAMNKGAQAPRARPKRGRPRDPQRLGRILTAARRHFHAQGFERTSLDVAAAESGVSKMTMYTYF